MEIIEGVRIIISCIVFLVVVFGGSFFIAWLIEKIENGEWNK